MKWFIAGVVLLSCLATAPTHADNFGFDTRKLTSADVQRALAGAEELAARRGKSKALKRNAPVTAVVGWLLARANAHTLAGNREMARTLSRRGYKADAIDTWSTQLGRVLLSHEAVRRGVVGKDVAKLYKQLARARGKRRHDLLRRIELASVSKAEAALVKPFSARIAALLAKARGGRR